LLCVVAFLFFSWLVPEKGQPSWVREAKTRPFLQSTGEQLMAMLPEDPLNTLQERVNRRLREGGDPPPETGAAPSGAQPPARRL
jgi:membrane protein required for colicin V production